MFSHTSIKEYFGFDSQWFQNANGAKVHYLDEGDKNSIPVLLIHGSAIGITAAANFYLTIPCLVNAGYRVIAPDMYGYGWTEDAVDVAPSRENQVQLIWDLMEHLEIPKIYLIGNSLGGMIAVSATLDRSEKILGQIIIGTGGAFWEHGSRRAPNPTSRADNTPYSRELVKKSMEHLVSNPEIIPNELLEFRIKMAEREGAYQRHILATQHREDSKKRLPFDKKKAQKCQVSTLFMYGKEDRVNPNEDALAGAEAFAHADMMLFGHCGHWTMIERADDFNFLMLNFLKGYDKNIVTPPVRSLKLKNS